MILYVCGKLHELVSVSMKFYQEHTIHYYCSTSICIVVYVFHHVFASLKKNLFVSYNIVTMQHARNAMRYTSSSAYSVNLNLLLALLLVCKCTMRVPVFREYKIDWRCAYEKIPE